jgi:hypothetical protein
VSLPRLISWHYISRLRLCMSWGFESCPGVNGLFGSYRLGNGRPDLRISLQRGVAALVAGQQVVGPKKDHVPCRRIGEVVKPEYIGRKRHATGLIGCARADEELAALATFDLAGA